MCVQDQRFRRFRRPTETTGAPCACRVKDSEYSSMAILQLCLWPGCSPPCLCASLPALFGLRCALCSPWAAMACLCPGCSPAWLSGLCQLIFAHPVPVSCHCVCSGCSIAWLRDPCQLALAYAAPMLCLGHALLVPWLCPAHLVPMPFLRCACASVPWLCLAHPAPVLQARATAVAVSCLCCPGLCLGGFVSLGLC